jgi:hypothetical protein
MSWMRKKLLFFAPAREIWICDQTNTIEFFDPKGQMAKSGFFPNSPNKICPYPNQTRAQDLTGTAKSPCPRHDMPDYG